MNQLTQREPTLEDLSAELIVYVGRLVRAVTRQASTTVATASLRLLSQVEELGPVTISALATADHCSQPTMSSGVQALCERGWTRKQPHPGDARSSLVSLTHAGRSFLIDARRERATVVTNLARSDSEHNEKDLATAVAVLRGLLDQADVQTDDQEEGTA